ncbi:MAG: hypothetical protein MJ159_05000 [Treponemataceae bacterium]|nr:hypothetical protein [Treponemataceae bacterium]
MHKFLKIVLLTPLLLLNCISYLCAQQKMINSIEIYGIPNYVDTRVPVTESRIKCTYAWKMELKTEHKINQFQDFFQAVENFEKNTIVDKNSIRLRIDFIYENEEISSKVFSEKDYDKIVDCIKLYFLS